MRRRNRFFVPQACDLTEREPLRITLEAHVGVLVDQSGVEGGIELIEREQAHVARLDLRVVAILGFVLSNGCVGHVGTTLACKLGPSQRSQMANHLTKPLSPQPYGTVPRPPDCG